MTMLKKSAMLEEVLEKELPPVFLATDALPFIQQLYSAPQKKLVQLEEQGFIVRLCRGIYAFRSKCDRYFIAGVLHSPSYISFETALSYYEMIPERVEVMYSVTKARAREVTTPLGSFVYRSQATELYSAGMSMIFVDDIPVLIASKEKALLDTMAQQNLETRDLTPEGIYEYALQHLRMDSTDLLSLSCRKLKTLAFHYRNHAPRKLYTQIAKLKAENKS